MAVLLVRFAPFSPVLEDEEEDPTFIDPYKTLAARTGEHGHGDSSVCKVCFRAIVFPGNGSKTRHFDKCFAEIERACTEDIDSHSFCPKMERDAGEEFSMKHVIEIENWKHSHCEWLEHMPYEPSTEVAKDEV